MVTMPSTPCFVQVGANRLRTRRVSACETRNTVTKHTHAIAARRGARKGLVSAWTTPEHIEITACFALEPRSRNTPLLSHCFTDVFPCVACVPPKGGRAARNTRAAALPWGAC
jgi:hypothetical protein